MRSNTSNVLPISFTPGPAHIIIGRGRVVKLHSGNRKMDHMVASIAQEYSAASGKAEKGMILSRLIDQIHDAAPDAGFVKRDTSTGRWYTVEESLSRTTVAQALRNYLNGEYRSSKQFKQQRRLEQIQQEMLQGSGMEGTTINVIGNEITRCVSPLNTTEDDKKDDSQTFHLLFAAFGIDTFTDLSPRPIAPTHPQAVPKIQQVLATPGIAKGPKNIVTPSSSAGSLLLSKLGGVAPMNLVSLQLWRNHQAAV